MYEASWILLLLAFLWMTAVWISIKKPTIPIYLVGKYIMRWSWSLNSYLIIPNMPKRVLPKWVATGRAFRVGLYYFVSACFYIINLNMKSVNLENLPIHAANPTLALVMVMMDCHGWWWTLCQNPFDDIRTYNCKNIIPFPFMTDLYFNMPI